MKRNSLFILGLLVPAAFAAACSGPGMKMLASRPRPALDSRDRVEIFIGKLDPPYEEIAKIDSEAYSFVNDDIKLRQLDQLRDRARGLGANTLDEVRILTKQVKGFTPDESVPFNAVQQGQYPLYFMRATALYRMPKEPASIGEIQPAEGWAVDKYAAPPRLDSILGKIPMPVLRDQATTATAAVKPAS